jgi:tellurite resistance protein TerC
MLKINLQAVRLIVIVVYFTILFVGIAMIFLPGSAMIVIPFGLGMIVIEVFWARKLLEIIKNKYHQKKEMNHAS